MSFASEKLRWLNHIRVLIYFCATGFLLLLAGGALLVYANLSSDSWMKDNEQSENVNDTSNQKFQISMKYVLSAKSSFVSPLSVVGYMIMSIGLLLIGFGFPLVYRFWKRYQVIKNLEKSPMLDSRFHENFYKVYGTHQNRRKMGVAKQKSVEKRRQSSFKNDSESLMKEKKTRFWSRKKHSDSSSEMFGVAKYLLQISQRRTLGIVESPHLAYSKEEKINTFQSLHPLHT